MLDGWGKTTINTLNLIASSVSVSKALK